MKMQRRNDLANTWGFGHGVGRFGCGVSWWVFLKDVSLAS